jgi:hypothetical protein
MLCFLNSAGETLAEGSLCNVLFGLSEELTAPGGRVSSVYGGSLMFGLLEGRREMEMHYKSWEKRICRGEQRPNDSWDNRSTQSGGIF